MIRPSFLQNNDKVGIVAPASAIGFEAIKNAMSILSSWGLQVILSDNIQDSHFQFAGDDEGRLLSLQKMLDDPVIKCIFCARGGYGTSRIIDLIDERQLIKYPKWIVGFSDITILHSVLLKNNISSIHGPMAINFHEKDSEISLQRLRAYLFDGEYPEISFENKNRNKPGSATGKLAGGNLTMIVNCLGTPTELDFKDKILFLEDVDEELYRIDRMVVQLKRSGKLNQLLGLILGHFTRVGKSHNNYGTTLEGIFLDHTSHFSYPVCFNAPVGHEMPNFPMIIGQNVYLYVENNKARLSLKENTSQ